MGFQVMDILQHGARHAWSLVDASYEVGGWVLGVGLLSRRECTEEDALDSLGPRLEESNKSSLSNQSLTAGSSVLLVKVALSRI